MKVLQFNNFNRLLSKMLLYLVFLVIVFSVGSLSDRLVNFFTQEFSFTTHPFLGCSLVLLAFCLIACIEYFSKYDDIDSITYDGNVLKFNTVQKHKTKNYEFFKDKISSVELNITEIFEHRTQYFQIAFDVKTTDGELFNINGDVNDILRIRPIFIIFKYIPNFSFKVNVGSRDTNEYITFLANSCINKNENEKEKGWIRVNVIDPIYFSIQKIKDPNNNIGNRISYIVILIICTLVVSVFLFALSVLVFIFYSIIAGKMF